MSHVPTAYVFCNYHVCLFVLPLQMTERVMSVANNVLKTAASTTTEARQIGHATNR